MKKTFFLYPKSHLDTTKPHEIFLAEYKMVQSFNFPVGLIDETLPMGQVLPVIPKECTGIVLRTGMMTLSMYMTLEQFLLEHYKIPLITSYSDYQASHYMPNWYSYVKEHTPKTYFATNEMIEAFGRPVEDYIYYLFKKLGVDRGFFKDFVKSSTASPKSDINNRQDVYEMVKEYQLYRDGFEGGVSIREWEEFLPDSEVRYFVLGTDVYDPDPLINIPDMVQEIANQHNKPFYTIDVVEDMNGNLRLVEISDAQTCEIKEWDMFRFCNTILRQL